MRRLCTVALTGAAIVTSTVFVAPAQAARAPVGGCGEGFELVTVKEMAKRAKNTPDQLFIDTDRNGDGYICNRNLPPGGGTVHDNTTQP